jgi:L-amino acid N-acyltransferase YncA
MGAINAKIRNATARDLDAVLAIFNYEIVNDVMAWDIEPIEGAARHVWFEAHSEPGYPLLVAEADNGTIVGWASLSRWAHHAAYARTVELSIYVDQARKRQGVGRALLAALVDAAREHGYHSLIGRSDTTNEASRRLHLGAGFRAVGVMREAGYKFGRYRDAEIYELLLD